MATTASLFSLPPLRLAHRRLLSPTPGSSASSFQTLAAKKAAASTVSGPGVGGAGANGILSMLDRKLTDEEYRRAPRCSKGVEAEGYGVEGISVGGHETCVTVPSLNVAFDIGRSPLFAVRQDNLFITHTHLDHIVSTRVLL